MENLLNNNDIPVTSLGGYWWNYAIFQGKLLIDGCYHDQQEALQFGYKNIPVNFETVCLATRDRSRATQVIKRKVWGDTGNIDLAIGRAKHKVKEE